MAGVADELLEEHRGVAERLAALLHRLGDGGRELAGVVAGQHPDAATTGDALHQQREPDPVGRRDRGVDVDERVGPAGERHARISGRRAGFVLGAEMTDLLRRGADEHQAGVLDRRRRVGVLGEEAVARVDCVGAVLGGHREQLLDAAVPRAGRGTDRNRERRNVAVERRPVDVGEHRDRLDPESVERADDSAHDLAAVRDQDSAHGSAGDHESDRRGIESVARVVDLWAIRDHDQHPHVARAGRPTTPVPRSRRRSRVCRRTRPARS